MTDEPKVIKEVEKSNFNFLWIYDSTSINLGHSEQTRYTPQGIDAIALDILKLSESDFIVCTFSSNVCRIAYSLRTAIKVISVANSLFLWPLKLEVVTLKVIMTHLIMK